MAVLPFAFGTVPARSISTATRLASSPIFRDASKLGGGALVSQIIYFAGVPLILFLYDPADFGLYSFIYTSLLLIGTLGTWKIERLIVVVPSRTNSIRLLSSLIYLAAATSALLLLLLLILSVLAAGGMTELPTHWMLMWAAPPTTFIMLTSLGWRSYALRQGRFGTISVAQVARATVFIAGTATTPLVWHGSGHGGALVMVSWQLAGDASALLIQLLANPGRDIALAFRPRIRKVFSTLLFYRKTLGALAVAQIIGSINQQLPITIVMFAFGATSAGLYSLASNLVYMPCKIISSAVGDVYNQRLARLHADGEPVFNLTARATIWMAVIGSVPFALIALLAADFLALVSGPDWQGAAYSIAILALGSYMFFISIPASNMALIVHARRYIVCWHVLRMATLGAFGGIAALGLISYEGWLILFVAGEMFVYAIEVLFGMHFARNADSGEAGDEIRA